MFLKRNRRKVDGETYEYWSLVRTVRTAKEPRHKLVVNLGKAPGLDSKTPRGWQEVVDLPDGHAGQRRYRQMKFGEAVEQDSLEEPLPEWTQVDVNGLRIERVGDFGEVYLALWRRLGLHDLLAELFEPGKEQVQWDLVACIFTLARFCGNPSELEVAERWYQDSALEDLCDSKDRVRELEAKLYGVFETTTNALHGGSSRASVP